ncbi:hybrid-cluster NAD(P)-dependent oxidoreductase [Aureimonas jatrophae]|uniref:Ferredoxin-NADP reductase n=1 Tax=Aureimonas jatrophae TaxID=1166073 RepID=A0A1H0DC19_9HYPH|nr:hybrid-cluster NAD(P)-dependent oxidoreductase [Aureimonas jatrophae]MBB3951808.1 ferredoxin-NADP reductase [Aureimonas jatrophae]SDN67678.1 Ferredoxin-NADP reductase [Aureimonas jatrophae]
MDALAPRNGPALWNPEEDEHLVCRAVREETHDVRTFVFAARSGGAFRFEPGQFLTFEFPVAGEPVYRCYTIASAPSRPDTVSITVKRVPGGPVSNWLHDTMRPGTVVKASGPMGEFSWARHPSPRARYLLVSGGSGVTPMMSMARTGFDRAETRDTVFVHAARTPLDIVFRDELDLMARRDRAFRAAFVVEGDAPGVGWGGYRGRLTLPMLESIAPDWREREVFVCGPAPFMRAVSQMLAGAGFTMAHHHEESFDFAELTGTEKTEAVEAEADLKAEARTFRIEFAKTRRQVDCPEDVTILEAARRAGIRLPASCTKGLCGTCKSKKASGEVAMHHGGGIRQREIDAGQILLCCSRPLSDVVIER